MIRRVPKFSADQVSDRHSPGASLGLIQRLPFDASDAPCVTLRAHVMPENGTRRQMAADDWHSFDAAVRKRAAQLCAVCPVREACAEYGRDDPDPFAIYGGVDKRNMPTRAEADRDRLVKRENERVKRAQAAELRRAEKVARALAEEERLARAYKVCAICRKHYKRADFSNPGAWSQSRYCGPTCSMKAKARREATNRGKRKGKA